MTHERGPLEKKLGNEIEVKLEILENPEASDGHERMLNGYVKDPTIHGERREGIDKDAYDYAELRIVPRKAYIQKENNEDEDDEDGDGYQVYTGPVQAETEQKTENIDVNQTLTKKDYKHDKMSKRKLSDQQTTKISPEGQSSSGEFNSYENLKSEDNFYVNRSNGMMYSDYENVNIKETDIGKMVTVLSKNVIVKTVNELIAGNTSSMNIDHVENMVINNTTTIQFVNAKFDKPTKESDKKSHTWPL
ncbi:uncharacterized protein LOC134690505 isoform X2 [Mytilus trossulus]|uniref:uncharacterized protein LOC134690505 isoform X2 n=1 Tax=Mytilus trossulus TaxID=6551 RepID=UPI003007163A